MDYSILGLLAAFVPSARGLFSDEITDAQPSGSGLETLICSASPFASNIRRARWALVAAAMVQGLLALIATPAAAVEIAGVNVSETSEVAGASLSLNGAGIRHKGPFKVYVAALYLGRKVSTPEAAYAATGPRRIVLTMLRDIESGELGRLFMRSMQDNTPQGELLKVLPALPRMGEIFAEQKSLASGESITIDWIPGTGTVISAKGKALGQPFKDPEFFHAMLAIWIGRSPADWMLKDALLGLSK